MAVSKLQLILVGLLAVQFLILVDATCNQCKNAHACINETSFKICYNDVRNDSISFTCPSDSPICTDYSVICMPNATTVVRGCGEVSKCNACGTDSAYACTSLNTFGRCSDGELTTGRATCPNNKVCSTTGAANNDNICVSRCDIDDGDICDRIEEVDDNATTESPTTTVTDSTTTSDTIVTDSTITSNTTVTDSTITSNTTVTESTTTSNVTVTESSTTTTTTTSTPITPEAYCSELQITGRYAIPNDTECISYIYCFFRSNNWQTVTYNCSTAQPYFNATAGVCGKTKPTGTNCTN